MGRCSDEGRPLSTRWSERDVGSRISGTLELMASRGYNPTMDRLSTHLLGGPVGIDELEDALAAHEGVHVEDGFVFPEGKRYVDACKGRVKANGVAQPLYMRVAEEFTSDLVRLCPWVRSVVLVGSAATGGLRKGDDLDLNLVVENGRKYTTNLFGSLLNRRYSLRFGRALGLKRSHHYMIPMVVCLNIIWEESQVTPFQRQDGQMAYEVFNSKVLHGEQYFEGILDANEWLLDYFPQMSPGREPHDRTHSNGPKVPRGNGPGILERLARGGMFNFDRVVRLFMSRQIDTIRVMDYYDDLKRPYGLYDIPECDNGWSDRSQEGGSD